MKKYCPMLADCGSCPNGEETDASYCPCCGLPLMTNPLTTTPSDDKLPGSDQPAPKQAVFHIRFPEGTTHEQLLAFLTELSRLNAESGLDAKIDIP